MPRFKGCSELARVRLMRAYQLIMKCEWLETSFPTLKSSIIQKWPDLLVECALGASKCAGLCGQWDSKHKVLIMCTISEKYTGAVVMHELVHACGGSELDAETIERICFDGNGATPPMSVDFAAFCKEPNLSGQPTTHVGHFVVWDAASGETWVRDDSSGQVAKGKPLFQDDFWKDACAA
jgi:hypothetical protein